jgi:hypothetical protein
MGRESIAGGYRGSLFTSDHWIPDRPRRAACEGGVGGRREGVSGEGGRKGGVGPGRKIPALQPPCVRAIVRACGRGSGCLVGVLLVLAPAAVEAPDGPQRDEVLELRRDDVRVEEVACPHARAQASGRRNVKKRDGRLPAPLAAQGTRKGLMERWGE